MTDKELLQYTPAQLVDMGVCPTCLDRRTGGGLYGDNAHTLFYADADIECHFVSNPRAAGHCCIVSVAHYHDLSEAPDRLNEKIVRFAKQLMRILVQVYGCRRVYMCTMCDGPMNHYHVQLIPRYDNEPRGSTNFVKPRTVYVYESDKFEAVREALCAYAAEHNE